MIIGSIGFVFVLGVNTFQTFRGAVFKCALATCLSLLSTLQNGLHIF